MLFSSRALRSEHYARYQWHYACTPFKCHYGITPEHYAHKDWPRTESITLRALRPLPMALRPLPMALRLSITPTRHGPAPRALRSEHYARYKWHYACTLLKWHYARYHGLLQWVANLLIGDSRVPHLLIGYTKTWNCWHTKLGI